MKTIKPLIALAIVCATYTPNLTAGGRHSLSQKNLSTCYYNIADDEKIKLKLVKDDWKIDIQVSFDGDEGNSGTLKVYNASNNLITQFEIDLKKSPEFYTINLNEFASGVYTFELITKTNTHTTHLKI